MSRLSLRAPFRYSLLFSLLFGASGLLLAQQDGKSPSANQAGSGPAQDKGSGTQGQQEPDLLKRPLSEKQKKENAKALKQELSKTYKKWLDEDVAWIISDEERKAFKQLSNDEERDQFIEA
ncbi:MAG TPA: hypothetical protein VLZ81_00035, partial [Blastocatellia bacterium]|nr:hypothetical protein [Blastocatellia bacterium]